MKEKKEKKSKKEKKEKKKVATTAFCFGAPVRYAPSHFFPFYIISWNAQLLYTRSPPCFFLHVFYFHSALHLPFPFLSFRSPTTVSHLL